MTSETAIQRGWDPNSGQRWAAKQCGKEDEGRSELMDTESLLHSSSCGSVLLLHYSLILAKAG